jgi:hypothetical protein
MAIQTRIVVAISVFFVANFLNAATIFVGKISVFLKCKLEKKIAEKMLKNRYTFKTKNLNFINK